MSDPRSSADFKPLGEHVLRVRAGASRNLPFVLVGRARLHHAVVARRSHARREPLDVVEGGEDGTLNPLTAVERRALADLFGRIARADTTGREGLVRRLEATVRSLLAPAA